MSGARVDISIRSPRQARSGQGSPLGRPEGMPVLVGSKADKPYGPIKYFVSWCDFLSRQKLRVENNTHTQRGQWKAVVGIGNFLGLLIEHETCFSSGQSACPSVCLAVYFCAFLFRVFAIWLNFNFCICKPIRKLQTEYWKLTENCKQLVSCSFNLLRPAGLVEFSSSVAHLSHTRTAHSVCRGRGALRNCQRGRHLANTQRQRQTTATTAGHG